MNRMHLIKVHIFLRTLLLSLEYKEETIMENNMPKILKIPTFEYNIIDIDNEYYHYKENDISI